LMHGPVLVGHLPLFGKKHREVIEESDKSDKNGTGEKSDKNDISDTNNMNDTHNTHDTNDTHDTHDTHDKSENSKDPDFDSEDLKQATMSSVVKIKVKRFVAPRKIDAPPSKTMAINECEQHVDVEALPEQLPSGSARTEGYFKLPDVVREQVRCKERLEAFSTLVGSKSGGHSSSSRGQNRMKLSSDLFRVSPLQASQKRVSLRSSAIHAFGLVALEPAEPGDLIIEYVGELVRASVANIRELRYERGHHGEGIASSYLFRLDDVMVIDATNRGNLARFINHSCDPSCVARTMLLNGSRRIVMYAKRHISVGDELTYDYKFPREKDPSKRVRCLCNAPNCRKYLN